MTKNKALFLDRDGVINVDKRYLFKIEDCEFVAGIFDLCKLAIEKKFLIVVVTNQAGVARGYYTENDMYKLHQYMENEFKKNGVLVSGFYYCPHHPEFTGKCSCRKPEPGLLLEAAEKLNIDLSQSYMIGDKLSDAYAGKNSGIKESLLVKGAYDIDNEEFTIFNSLHEIKRYMELREE